MLLVSLLAGLSAPAAAQRPVTMEEAVASALATGPRVALARADSAAARAAVVTARAFPNPSLALDYTKDPPRRHVLLEQPLELPWVRSARIGAARSAAEAATYTLQAERAAVRYLVQAAYARAAAAQEVRRLSERNARDGQELLRITQERQRAGDASELDVELARVTAGQLESAALSDSADALLAVLDLQSLIGLATDRVEVTLADSLAAPQAAPPPVAPARPLRVAAAELALRSRRSQEMFVRRSRVPVPSLRAGLDQGEPGGDNRALPAFGISLPLPVFNRGRGDVAEAHAEAVRAEAELAQAQRESAAARAAAERQRAVAIERVARDRLIVRDAQRVTEMSLTAYREGAAPLVNVLEAQRNARDALRQYVTDLAASRTAEAAYLLAVSAGERP
ncbi:MAG TPA: TolC family protein [Longimicrobiales bacterium]|nr:TolC family protein [Longimicrobiales bacterium]